MLAQFFAQLTFDVDGRAVLTLLQRLILVERLIYPHRYAAQRDGRSVCFPFYAATSFAAVKSAAQATTSTTVSIERDGVKLCLT